MSEPEQEMIIFVDEHGRPTGETGPKLKSHTANTKRHLAFSCYIFHTNNGKFLATQRALSKKVWPGVWTNSVCGHPAPGESMEDAILRRAKFELGLNSLTGLEVVLPQYKYTTPPYDGIIENEFCPVYVAFVNGDPEPNTAEVEHYMWVDWPAYLTMLRHDPEKMSYWTKGQCEELEKSGQFRSLIEPASAA